MGSSTTDSDATSLHAPRHPVPQLQGPFEESMAESINEAIDNAKPDPVARRTMLIEGPTYERVCAGRWKQRPGEKFHPLWKISAQMSFGIHLLAEGLARSEDDVMNILQTHVDDVDGFLESTTEDFDLSQSDVAERLRYLKLPLEHVEVFDRMLEDRAFRVSIVQGNEKIEHIMERTSEATKDALKDIQKGLQATNALGKYLEKVNLSWTARNEEHDAVFVAMVGNVDGWHRAFEDLYRQGNRLGKSLIELAAIVSEMQRRAGVASRKTLLRNEHDYAATRSQEPSFRQLRDGDNYVANKSKKDTKSSQVPSKPLPKAPGLSIGPAQTTRRTSFQDGRSRQTSSAAAEDKSILYKSHGDGQANHKSVSGDRTTGLKNQKSASDLKSKPGGSNRADANGSSDLALLGLGSGLGLGRIMETNSSRPVIIQRRSTPDGPESSGTLLDSKSKIPREHSAPVLTVPLQDQVPPQNKRLSFSLRNKNKDRQAPFLLDPASPEAPDQPLESALSAQMGSSPGLAGTLTIAVSPAPIASHASSHYSYFSKSPYSSPRVVSPSPEQSTPGSAATAKPPRKFNGNNPTFTSHPPNMEMATSPPLKHGQTSESPVGPLEVPGLKAVPDLDSGNTSYESSLGEPGPEVSATEEGDDATQETPIAELDSGNSVAQVLVELEADVPHSSQPVAFELEAPQHSRPAASNTGAKMSPLTPTVGATIQSHSDFFKLPPQQAGDHPGERIEFEREPTQVGQTFVAKDSSRTALLHRSFQLPAADESRVSALLPQDTGESRDAVRRRSFQLPTEGQSTGISLTSADNAQSQNAAPTSSFELPADTGAQRTNLNPVTDESRKATQLRSFQLLPEGRLKDTTPNASGQDEMRSTVRHRSFQLPPSDSSHADLAKADAEDGGDKSDLPRDDRQTLISRMSTSEATPKSKRVSPKYHLNLIDIISHTPPGSPIHERPPSTASFHSAANSARVNSYRGSIDLAPPEEAPAPPAPGGRGMVSPDYAAAGAFEGEKRPKRTSGASMNGLKRMLSRGSASHSTTGSVRVVELAEGRMSGGGVHDNVDLMTAGGSDVLWFKGMGRDGVWVCGS